MDFKQYNIKHINDQETGCKMKLWCIRDGKDFRIRNTCAGACGKNRDYFTCQIGFRNILNYQDELLQNYPAAYLLPESPQMIAMFQEFSRIHQFHKCCWSNSGDDIKWWFDNFKDLRR